MKAKQNKNQTDLSHKSKIIFWGEKLVSGKAAPKINQIVYILFLFCFVFV